MAASLPDAAFFREDLNIFLWLIEEVFVEGVVVDAVPFLVEGVEGVVVALVAIRLVEVV